MCDQSNMEIIIMYFVVLSGVSVLQPNLTDINMVDKIVETASTTVSNQTQPLFITLLDCCMLHSF